MHVHKLADPCQICDTNIFLSGHECDVYSQSACETKVNNESC